MFIYKFHAAKQINLKTGSLNIPDFKELQIHSCFISEVDKRYEPEFPIHTILVNNKRV